MPITVTCQSCRKTMKFVDKAAGKAAKCKHCNTRLVIPHGDQSPFDSTIDLAALERSCPAAETPSRRERHRKKPSEMNPRSNALRQAVAGLKVGGGVGIKMGMFAGGALGWAIGRQIDLFSVFKFAALTGGAGGIAFGLLFGVLCGAFGAIAGSFGGTPFPVSRKTNRIGKPSTNAESVSPNRHSDG